MTLAQELQRGPRLRRKGCGRTGRKYVEQRLREIRRAAWNHPFTTTKE